MYEIQSLGEFKNEYKLLCVAWRHTPQGTSTFTSTQGGLAAGLKR